MRTLLLVVLLLPPSQALAQAGTWLASPTVSPPAPAPATPPRHAPAVERGALYSGGMWLGLLGAAGLATGMYVTLDSVQDDNRLSGVATAVTAGAAAMLLIPTGVFVFGQLGGRRANFLWTLLGAVLGAAPGAALAYAGLADGLDLGQALALTSSGLLWGVSSACLGAVLAFEMSSSTRSDPAGDVELGVGPGGVQVRGRF